MLEQERYGVVDGAGLDRVVVVEDEREIFGYRGDFVDERRKNRLDGRRLGRMEGLEGILSDAGPQATKSGYQVRQKTPEVVIPLVQRDPCNRQPALEAPLPEQRGLAEARGRRYKSQFALSSLVQPLDKARACYEVGLD
ncbi:MAG TPA: hypothetical protein VGV91_19180 [Rubrobacter sp.]|nr:hypothetical protein [Rubrobacter sp.]